MKNDITEFYPFENYATFDRVRKLKWNNNATLQAISYFNTVHGKKITRNNLIEGLASGAVEYIIAALYGALCAADKRITLPIFNRIYKPEYLSEYIKAVYEGAKANEPEPVIKDTGADLDPDWPDTQSEAKKKQGIEQDDFGYWLWFAKSKIGLSLDEIKETTYRGLIALYWRYWEDKGVTMYDGDDI